MKNETREALESYTSQIALLNHVGDASLTFTVEPTIEQKLEDRIQEQAEFLQAVNVVPVEQLEGEKLRIGANATIAGRTDTNEADRKTQDPTGLSKDTYRVHKTNFDTHITYATLDLWAKFEDFETRMRDHVVRQIARDRLMIGFNGIEAAATTDRAANPLLQDVNVGWLQHLRLNAINRVLSGVKVGPINGNDYRNIDAAVLDAVNELIEPWHREDSGLVVIAGRRIVADKYLALMNDTDKPTERNALETLMMNKQFGGLPTIRVPFFPSNAFMITSPDNLSIYWQTGTRRRHIMERPERDRVEDFQSVNEGYVIEDYEKCCLIEGILTPNAEGDGWE